MVTRTLKKRSFDDKLYDMDFSPKARAGDTISAVTSVTSTKLDRIAPSTNLTVGATAFSGLIAQVRLSAGTDQEDYEILFKVTTTGLDILEAEGLLRVRD